MELENLFENINLDYEYNRNDNLAIIEEILSNKNIDEIYKMCLHIKKNFITDRNHIIYNSLPTEQKEQIQIISDIVNTILEIYPYHSEIMLEHFLQLYKLMKRLCFT